MRILFATVPLSGHFFPLVPLAWAYRAAGAEVVVTTSADYLPTVLRAGLPATPAGPAADFTGLAGHGYDDAAEHLLAHGRVFARVSAANLVGTLRLAQSWQPDLVVYERAAAAGAITAAVHGVPGVELQWGVPALREYRAAADEVLAGELSALGLPGLPRADHVVGTWPPSLRHLHAAEQSSMRHVPYNGDARLPDWLAVPPRRPRVCLTLGTVLPGLGTAGLFLALLEELSTLDIELVVAVADETAAAWGTLPSSVLHAGRLPLAQALRTCDAVVHHGGNGTSLAALEAGVPQLVLPHFDDQIGNAEAVVRSGAGLRLSPGEITPEAVAAGCARLLADARFAEVAAAVAAENAAQPSPAEVVRTLTPLALRPELRRAG
ncbi:UDP:flavonoid glycosyltransferase YjiC (YdhE family) [Amycolatopsis lexingtonensis]|uniref:UDP:flavonoid glycosyltransferase YjiC (YdhE family) n=1 Tax=Amycolatopsis lexingtonensis TaxID=218822 RepID=A0ABR9IG50_9PSEU|nr:nucleotide disphospho-sugar-binding domain-containing protein [Amycolatopsis lexingtonensis]MBE1502130.1 UDP:flavonoid glycosyltransferase YjiC (YdhE family) [Amycolatopsis lexingtonensis]